MMRAIGQPKPPVFTRWGASLRFVAGLLPIWDRLRDAWSREKSSPDELPVIQRGFEVGSLVRAQAEIASFFQRHICPMLDLAEARVTHPILLAWVTRLLRYSAQDVLDECGHDLVHFPAVVNIIEQLGRLNEQRMQVAHQVLIRRGFVCPLMVASGYARPPSDSPFDGVTRGEWLDYLAEARAMPVTVPPELPLEEATKRFLDAGTKWSLQLQAAYPCLSRELRRNLAMCVSNAPIERAFSIMRRKKSPTRHSLSTQTLLLEINLELDRRSPIPSRDT
jgi:hypothetical protein